MDYLKAEQLSNSKWRVLSIPFGGPFAGKDFDGEFFSRRTDIKPDWFDRRPLVWHHNLDKTMDDDSVLGTADDTELEEKEGWWSTVWLNRQHRYFAEVAKRLGKGQIYGSSGTMPNFVKTDRKTGEILVWPFIEQTLTPTPSNIYSVVTPMKAVEHFDAADIVLSPALKGILTDLDSPTADLPADLATSVVGDAAATRERLLGAIRVLDAKAEALKNL